MAKSKFRRAQKTDGTGRAKLDLIHVRLYRWVLNTAAWKSLPPVCRALLVELYARYNGRNNGNLFLSVRDAGQALGVSKNTAARAFRILIERGFIRPNQPGAFSWKTGKATTWILTEYPYANALATKDFTRWTPETGKNAVPSEKRSVPPLGQVRTPTYQNAANSPLTDTDFAEMTKMQAH